MCRPLTAVMMSPSRRPHWRAGQSLFSVRPTTNTPSAKSLMPTAFPKGITVFSSAGEAKACCQHRESANTTASSHPALRRIVEVLRVSYKLLTPRFLLFCRRDSFTLRRGCPTHEMKKQVELENGAVERNLRVGKFCVKKRLPSGRRWGLLPILGFDVAPPWNAEPNAVMRFVACQELPSPNGGPTVCFGVLIDSFFNG